jgi:hypothetical protein
LFLKLYGLPVEAMSRIDRSRGLPTPSPAGS